MPAPSRNASILLWLATGLATVGLFQEWATATTYSGTESSFGMTQLLPWLVVVMLLLARAGLRVDRGLQGFASTAAVAIVGLAWWSTNLLFLGYDLVQPSYEYKLGLVFGSLAVVVGWAAFVVRIRNDECGSAAAFQEHVPSVRDARWRRPCNTDPRRT